LAFLKMSPHLAEIEELALAIDTWEKKNVKVLTVIPGLMYVLYSAEEIEKLLRNHDKKRPLPQNLLADGIGHPISSDGAPYYDSIQPFKENLSDDKLKHFISPIAKSVDKYVQKWLATSHEDGFDIVTEVNKMYGEIVNATLLGGKNLPEFGEFAKIVDELG